MENFKSELERKSKAFPTECEGKITEGEVYAIFDYVRHPERYENITKEDVARVMYFDSHVDSCARCTNVFSSRLDTEELVAFYLKNKEPEAN